MPYFQGYDSPNIGKSDKDAAGNTSNKRISRNKKEQMKAVVAFYRNAIRSPRVKVYVDGIGTIDQKTNISDLERQMREDWKLTFLHCREAGVIGCGTHQAVLSLGNSLVAKIPYEKTEYKGIIHLKGSYPFLQETRDALIEFGVPVPEILLCRAELDIDTGQFSVHSDVTHRSRRAMYRKIEEITHKRSREESFEEASASLRREWKQRARGEYAHCPDICITKDLREDGRYIVVEYDKKVVNQLRNGKALAHEFAALTSLLKGLYLTTVMLNRVDGQGPFLEYEPHKENTIEESIKKMFLLQVPTQKNEDGKLVAGDIDHVYLFK